MGTGEFRRGKNWFGVRLLQTSSEDGSKSPTHERNRAFFVEYKPEERGTNGGSNLIQEVIPTPSGGDGLDVWLDSINQEVYMFVRD